jgi:uncharacterized membrane protein
MDKQKVILIISGLSFIALITLLSLVLKDQFGVKDCGCPRVVSQNFIFIFVFLSIVFIGGIVYYLLSLQIKQRDRALEFNLETIMKFLDGDEKEVLNQIKKNNGKMLQSNISKISRLRAHRAIKKLSEKNIILLEKIGRENKLEINKKFEVK